MTVWKSNGVLTTRKRSGQVKPSNSMASARRTSLRAPSAPISQRTDRVSRRPLRLTATLDARGMLRHVLDRAVELQLEFRAPPQLIVKNAGQLGLLGL